jgi:hypothetical protein
MIINPRKIRKILKRIWTAPKRIFEIFSTQEAPRCNGISATLTTIYLLKKIKQGFFLYYISYKENKCWKNFKIMKNLSFNYSFYSHPEIGNFRV